MDSKSISTCAASEASNMFWPRLRHDLTHAKFDDATCAKNCTCPTAVSSLQLKITTSSILAMAPGRKQASARFFQLLSWPSGLHSLIVNGSVSHWTMSASLSTPRSQDGGVFSDSVAHRLSSRRFLSKQKHETKHVNLRIISPKCVL